MTRIKVSYETQAEKLSLIESLQHNFKVCKISKEYGKDDPFKKVYIDIKMLDNRN